jgi:hypothetical protein
MEKYENGWFLSVLRSNPNEWYMFAPDDIKSAFDVDPASALKFKEIRPLIVHSRMVLSSDERNDDGFPLVTVFAHKKHVV